MNRPPLPRADDPIFFARVTVNRHLTKKNGRNIMRNRRTGRSFLGKSSQLSNAEHHLEKMFKNIKDQLGITKPLDGRLHACFRFYFDDFYTARGKQRLTLPDMSNLLELPQDCLQKAGVIANDTMIEHHDGSRRLPGVANVLEVWIWREGQ